MIYIVTLGPKWRGLRFEFRDIEDAMCFSQTAFDGYAGETDNEADERADEKLKVTITIAEAPETAKAAVTHLDEVTE